MGATENSDIFGLIIFSGLSAIHVPAFPFVLVAAVLIRGRPGCNLQQVRGDDFGRRGVRGKRVSGKVRRGRGTIKTDEMILQQ